MPNIDSPLQDHVTLQVECIDRIYLNTYVPKLQRSGQLVWFFREHRKCPVVSPAMLGQMSRRFVASIKEFLDARENRQGVAREEWIRPAVDG